MSTNTYSKTALNKAALPHLPIALAPGWQTEPTAQVLMRDGMRQRIGSKTPESLFMTPLDLAKPEGVELWDQVEWESYGWQPQGHGEKRKPRGAGIRSFACRLMAIERARIRRGKPSDLFAHLLSKKAQWAKRGV